jgi:hypothetical protein
MASDDVNSIDLTLREDHFGIDIENPWAGSTDTGFGQTLGVMLDRSDAETLCECLIERLGLGWQPIETAPMNQEVLISDGQYVHNAIREYGAEPPDDCWRVGFVWDGARSIMRRPTHWMPVPEPPK